MLEVTKKSHLSARAQWRGLSYYTVKVMIHETISAQHGIATLMRRCFELLHCSNIATLCCAKSRHCESSRVTSLLVLKSGQLIAKLDLRNLL